MWTTFNSNVEGGNSCEPSQALMLNIADNEFLESN